jgi:hypothetical protein
MIRKCPDQQLRLQFSDWIWSPLVGQSRRRDMNLSFLIKRKKKVKRNKFFRFPPKNEMMSVSHRLFVQLHHSISFESGLNVMCSGAGAVLLSSSQPKSTFTTYHNITLTHFPHVCLNPLPLFCPLVVISFPSFF